jgi:pyruvate/2-oxoglutarate/acetoin dehydrogenase E1 component
MVTKECQMVNIQFAWVADIKREGTDVTIVSWKIIKEAHIAADELAKEGISWKLSI